MFAPTLKNVLIVYGILTAYAFHDFKEINNTLRPSINQNNVIVPTFNPIGPFCVGEAPPSLPTTSLEGISGTWIPPVINNTATTDYTFTPNLTLHPTAEEVDLRIVINERIEPTFDLVGPICAGDILSPLPITSNEGIQGYWTPSVINNTMTTTYIFTPNLDECARSTSLSIFVRQLDITPTFDIISPVCAEAIPILRTVSNEGIIGSWDPPTIDVTRSRTYIFQPVSDPNQCAGPTNLYIEILSSGSVTPDFASIDAICAGDLLAPLPTTSLNGITGTRSPLLNNMTTTEYTFTPNNPDQCATSETMTINVNTISSLAISVKNLSEDFDTNQIIMATATGGSGTYEFRLNGGLWQSNPIFENLRGCNDHIVSVRDAMGCSDEPQDSITILEYPKFFTPNNDGYNDTWNIKCLRNNPLAVVTIFDRYGKVLERFKPSQNSWNGLYNGLPLLSTDYWFLVEYVKTTCEILTKKGHFSLKR